MVATASIAAALRCLIDALMLLALGEREDWTKWRRIRVSPKVPDVVGESVRPSNKRFLVPRRVCRPNGISVCQSVHPILQGARSQTTKTTERRDMRRNSPHPAMWRYGLSNNQLPQYWQRHAASPTPQTSIHYVR